MTAPAKSSLTARRGHPGKGRRRARPSASNKEIWALLDEAGLGHDVGFMMRIAQLAFLDRVPLSTKGSDLTASQRTIMRVIDARPALTQQRIADALRIKRANLTPLINELVALGLVSRESSEQSRRAYAVHLTAKGKRALKNACKALPGRDCCADDLLDDAEQKELLRLLRKMAGGQ
jgi:DNA-binding MarR family transcriptional regulator